MQKYVKESYEALEKVQAGKGTKIITILQEMQVPSVKEVKPEQYEDLYSKIEALRAG